MIEKVISTARDFHLQLTFSSSLLCCEIFCLEKANMGVLGGILWEATISEDEI